MTKSELRKYRAERQRISRGVLRKIDSIRGCVKILGVMVRVK